MLSLIEIAVPLLALVKLPFLDTSPRNRATKMAKSPRPVSADYVQRSCLPFTSFHQNNGHGCTYFDMCQRTCQIAVSWHTASPDNRFLLLTPSTWYQAVRQTVYPSRWGRTMCTIRSSFPIKEGELLSGNVVGHPDGRGRDAFIISGTKYISAATPADYYGQKQYW